MSEPEYTANDLTVNFPLMDVPLDLDPFVAALCEGISLTIRTKADDSGHVIQVTIPPDLSRATFITDEAVRVIPSPVEVDTAQVDALTEALAARTLEYEEARALIDQLRILLGDGDDNDPPPPPIDVEDPTPWAYCHIPKRDGRGVITEGKSDSPMCVLKSVSTGPGYTYRVSGWQAAGFTSFTALDGGDYTASWAGSSPPTGQISVDIRDANDNPVETVSVSLT